MSFWLWDQKVCTCQAVPNCCRNQITKYQLLKLRAFGVQGLRKCCRNPKISQKKKQNLYLVVCIKAKTGEKFNYFFSCLHQGQNQFCSFLGGKKKIFDQLNYKISYVSCSCIWKCKKKHVFKALVIFERENIAAQQKIADFFGMNFKICLMDSNVLNFENLKKCWITPP